MFGVTPTADFYRIANGPRAAWLPRPLRLAVKGADHVLSMARLLARRSRVEVPEGCVGGVGQFLVGGSVLGVAGDAYGDGRRG